MREMKFRIWVEGKMQIPLYIRLPITESIPVMQYTGEKDKNDKEVFEGDIIRIYEYYCEEEPELNEWKDRVVEWDECGQYLSIEWNYGDYDIASVGWAFEHFDNSNNEVEIIGNIYENPHLLEDKA
jgi:uncharacterized phage protein (TIGR01671 family)